MMEAELPNMFHGTSWQRSVIPPETNVLKAEMNRSFGLRGWNSRKSPLYHYGDKVLAELSFKNAKFDLPSRTRSTFITAFSPDNSLLASCHGDHNVHILDVKTKSLIKSLSGHERSPWCVTFHPGSNEILATGSLNGEVRVWDLRGEGSESWTVNSSEHVAIASLSFHPYDHVLAIAAGNEIHFWDWSYNSPFASVKTNSESEKVRFVRFDPWGHSIITGVGNPEDEEDDNDDYTFDHWSWLFPITRVQSRPSRYRHRRRNHPASTRDFGYSDRTTGDSYQADARELLEPPRLTTRWPTSGRRGHRLLGDRDRDRESLTNRVQVDNDSSMDHSTSGRSEETEEVNGSRSSLSQAHQRILHARVSVNAEIQQQYSRLQMLRQERHRLEMRLRELQNSANEVQNSTPFLNDVDDLMQPSGFGRNITSSPGPSALATAMSNNLREQRQRFYNSLTNGPSTSDTTAPHVTSVTRQSISDTRASNTILTSNTNNVSRESTIDSVTNAPSVSSGARGTVTNPTELTYLGLESRLGRTGSHQVDSGMMDDAELQSSIYASLEVTPEPPPLTLPLEPPSLTDAVSSQDQNQELWDEALGEGSSQFRSNLMSLVDTAGRLSTLGRVETTQATSLSNGGTSSLVPSGVVSSTGQNETTSHPTLGPFDESDIMEIEIPDVQVSTTVSTYGEEERFLDFQSSVNEQEFRLTPLENLQRNFSQNSERNLISNPTDFLDRTLNEEMDFLQDYNPASPSATNPLQEGSPNPELSSLYNLAMSAARSARAANNPEPTGTGDPNVTPLQQSPAVPIANRTQGNQTPTNQYQTPLVALEPLFPAGQVTSTQSTSQGRASVVQPSGPTTTNMPVSISPYSSVLRNNPARSHPTAPSVTSVTNASTATRDNASLLRNTLSPTTEMVRDAAALISTSAAASISSAESLSRAVDTLIEETDSLTEAADSLLREAATSASNLIRESENQDGIDDLYTWLASGEDRTRLGGRRDGQTDSRRDTSISHSLAASRTRRTARMTAASSHNSRTLESEEQEFYEALRDHPMSRALPPPADPDRQTQRDRDTSTRRDSSDPLASRNTSDTMETSPALVSRDTSDRRHTGSSSASRDTSGGMEMMFSLDDILDRDVTSSTTSRAYWRTRDITGGSDTSAPRDERPRSRSRHRDSSRQENPATRRLREAWSSRARNEHTPGRILDEQHPNNQASSDLYQSYRPRHVPSRATQWLQSRGSDAGASPPFTAGRPTTLMQSLHDEPTPAERNVTNRILRAVGQAVVRSRVGQEENGSSTGEEDVSSIWSTPAEEPTSVSRRTLGYSQPSSSSGSVYPSRSFLFNQASPTPIDHHSSRLWNEAQPTPPTTRPAGRPVRISPRSQPRSQRHWRSRRTHAMARSNINRIISSVYAENNGHRAVVLNIDSTTYRLQWWDFTQLKLPEISRSDINVIVAHCKIYNDSSVDVSKDGQLLAAFVPTFVGSPDNMMNVAIFSLEANTFGQLLFKKAYGPNAVCLSISPLCNHICVGLKSRQFLLGELRQNRHLMAQILEIKKGASDEMPVARHLFHPAQDRPHRLVSINTISWVPEVGGGIVYGTNNGDLRMCYTSCKRTHGCDDSLDYEGDGL